MKSKESEGRTLRPDDTIALPDLAIRPVRFPIGALHHIIRLGLEAEIAAEDIVASHGRGLTQTIEIGTGERIVLTDRTNLPLPAEADGVLQRLADGTIQWTAHRLRNAVAERAVADGWPAAAAAVARRWDGQFTFAGERLREDGTTLAGLRPPQLGALHAIGAHWSLDHAPATIVMPTGTGKTETMLSALAAFVRGPMLVIVPGDVLRSQTARKFLSFGLLRRLGALAPDAPNPLVGVISRRPKIVADLDIFRSCNVIVSTMSALAGGEALGLAPAIAEMIDTLVVDEAHHIGARGWSAFRAAFAKRRVLQFTATPFRRDGQVVDGKVIYNYPLGSAQRDGYFTRIAFKPVYEMDPAEQDRRVAEAAVSQLRADLDDGLDHLLMARCTSIARAKDVVRLYQATASDLTPVVVDSHTRDAEAQIAALRSGRSRIVVCVNMLGEGFDLPQLKVAAIHDPQKSLAVFLQFAGRFTRTAGDWLGSATAIANIADPEVPPAMERLYAEDADWNHLLSDYSSEATREHTELVAFLNASERLDQREDDFGISHQLLRPIFSTLVFSAEEFHPRRFHEGLPIGLQVHRVWLHQPSSTLFFVTRLEQSVRWTRSRELRDRQWALFVLHHDRQRRLLYLSSTDHSSLFEGLAQSVGAGSIVSGDPIFRSLGQINRLVFQNIGVKKHGRRNLRYAMYTGASVAEALSLSERAGSVKSNLNGTGWEGGRPIAIGCSYKGRIWSREQGSIPQFVQWCEGIGAKIVNEGIETRDIIANVLIPEEVDRLPDKEVLCLDWPVEFLSKAEERIIFVRGAQERPLSMVDIRLDGVDHAEGVVRFDLITADDGPWARYALRVGGQRGFAVTRDDGHSVLIRIGALEVSLESYLSDYPPLVRFVDLTELDGDLLVCPQHPQELAIDEARFEPWQWQGVDLTKESIWKDGVERRDSIQWTAALHFVDAGFDVVFDDDAAGEAADLVCIKEDGEHIRLALVHCKFAGDLSPGERVRDVVEVASQAVRSSKWKWRFKELCRHITGRERRLSRPDRPTRFLAGTAADLNRIAKVSRFKEVRAEILVVQPGLSQRGRTPDQSSVLASAIAYLQETVGVDLDIICSS